MSDYRHLQYYAQQPHPQQPVAGSSAAPAQRHPSTSHSEDLKYIEKYKELKRRVKQTEFDNDRLHLKVLKTRKNIQRLRLERAILYERLSTTPAADMVPFPSDPGIFHSTQPHQQHHVTAHQDNLSAPEACVKCIPRDIPRPQAPYPPPASQLPARHHARHPEDSPRAGPSRSQKLEPEPEPSAPPAAVPGTTHSAGARTFPFVLEYALSPVSAAPTTAYPAEVRFYPYETSSYPAQRNRRDFEPVENGARGADRERELKFRHHRPEIQPQPPTRSPRSAESGHAHPLQRPVNSPEDARRNAEGDHNAVASHGFGQLPEEGRRRKTVNCDRQSKESPVHERPRDYGYGQQQDGGLNLPPRWKGSYSRSEQDLDPYEHARDTRDERTGGQRAFIREVEGRAQAGPSRMQAGDTTD